ncbi:MAG: hypothetical protein ABFR82_14330 [Nitrospirota bacterium]
MTTSSNRKTLEKFLSKKILPSAILFIPALLLLFLFNGCASMNGELSAGSPQTIKINEALSVHAYTSLKELRSAYLYRGGSVTKFKRLKGFYSKRDNTIHCIKWDYYTCGHELFHVLQYKGDTSLIVEKGYEHFRENYYTSP